MVLVCTGSRVGTDGHQFRPFSTGIARFFIQFTLGGVHWVFSLFHASGWNFDGRQMLGVAVLAFHKEFAFFGDGDDIAEFRIFQHVVVLNLCTCRQFDVFAPCGQPGALEYILAFKHFPGHGVFVLFAHKQSVCVWLVCVGEITQSFSSVKVLLANLAFSA